MSRRRPIWLAVSTLVVVVGAVASIFGATALARDDQQRSRQAFVSSSTEIASKLKVALGHEQDLVLSASAYFLSNPDASEADYLQWTKSVHTFEQYPELMAIAEVSVVPASKLHHFVAHQESDGAYPPGAKGSFVITPAGNRPYYCLGAVGSSRNDASAFTLGLDYCESRLGPELEATRDSGQAAYLPVGAGAAKVLAVGSAIYRGGVVPPTLQDRRAALIGWTGAQILPGVVLAAALENFPNTAVALRYDAGPSHVTFTSGPLPEHAQKATINLRGGWRVETLGTVAGGAVLANGDARVLLLGSLLLSMTLGAFIYVLGTSRARALALVGERTVQLHHQAFHDSLTGLPNRALILDRVSQVLARSRREGTVMAVLFIDLDNFKDINDTLGHGAGDELLVEVGARLRNTVREQDSVGRLGGDEFIVVAQGSASGAGGEALAARVLDAFSLPFTIPGSEVALSITASIGIAQGRHSTSEELLRNADIALYRAKAEGKQGATLFVPSMQTEMDETHKLAVDLRSAVETGQFFLLYQPTFNLATGVLTGAEALLRWHHPDRGLILADEFIPSLEASGLIVPVGQWVLDSACRQAAQWHRRGHRISISVNISARQLERDRIVDDVHGALSASGLDPALLTLELTETALPNDATCTSSRLQLLKALGVRLAIDDFGMGYSSFTSLQRFPIDALKIDRSFVSVVAENAKSAAIIHTLVELGKALELEIIAEGIETHEQLKVLSAEPIDTGQGFLFSPPVDVTAMDRLLRTDAHAGVGA